MKNIERKLKIILLFSAIIAGMAVISVVYIKAVSSIYNLKSNIAKLETRYNELAEKNANKENYNYELKYINYEMNQVQKVLPPDILQEYIILSLRRIEKASGTKMTSIKFSSVEKAGQSGKPSAAENNNANDTKSSTSNSKTTAAKSSSSTAKSAAPETNKNTEKSNNQKVFSDGEQIEMKVEVSYRAPYSAVKKMLNEISREKNRVIIDDIVIQRDPNNSRILSGSVNLTFCALKDSKRTLDAWELQLEKGVPDLFLPFEGYTGDDDVILPAIEDKYKSEDITSDFYMLASPFNDEKPAVLIGKYDSVNSEIFYDGNNTIDLNFYIEERNGQMYFRTRTKQMPYPDETNSVIFFPKQDDITMNVIASQIIGNEDKARVRLNVYNNSDRKVTVYMDDLSGRVNVVVKEGKVITEQKTLHN